SSWSTAWPVPAFTCGSVPQRTPRHGEIAYLTGALRRHHDAVVEILVIEDEVRMARALGQGLESRGFKVTLCHDGQTGYRHAKERSADVIVLDLMLPALPGEEVCRRLRAEGVWTPILVLTAREAESDETDVLNMGADDYLRKPFSLDVLV